MAREPGTLTWRQQKILKVLRDHQAAKGFPPSMRELGDAVGLSSTSSVFYELGQLQEKGYITRAPGKQRALILAEIPSAVTVPRDDLLAALAGDVEAIRRLREAAGAA